jgi:hypothetical protein
VSSNAYSFRDFSRAGILARRNAGRGIALAALRSHFNSHLTV